VVEKLKVEGKSLELLESAPLRKAYVKYIENTSMHQKSPEQTFEQLHVFLSEFEVSPKLVYKAMTYLIFLYLLRARDSHGYDLDDFKKMLIFIAEIYWRRVEGEDRGQEQKITLVLQQMELSTGFKKMVDKTLKETAIMVSFFKKAPSHRLNTESRMRASLEKDLSKSVERQAPKTAKHQHEKCASSFFSAKRTERK
jgi:hypothetical protein